MRDFCWRYTLPRLVSSDGAPSTPASASSNFRVLPIRTQAGVVADGVSSAETSNFCQTLASALPIHTQAHLIVLCSVMCHAFRWLVLSCVHVVLKHMKAIY